MRTVSKAEWIAALRNGEYEQTRGVLCRLGAHGEVQGFCCLGVLCDLVEVPHLDMFQRRGYLLVVRQKDGSLSLREDLYKEEHSVSTDLMNSVLGVPKTSSAGFLTRSQVVNMNDSGSSFSEIADYLETI